LCTFVGNTIPRTLVRSGAATGAQWVAMDFL
jgi:hypothetical protein